MTLETEIADLIHDNPNAPRLWLAQEAIRMVRACGVAGECQTGSSGSEIDELRGVSGSVEDNPIFAARSARAAVRCG